MNGKSWMAVKALDASGNLTGDAIDIRSFNGLSIQVVTTGAGTATLTMEETNYPLVETKGDPAKVKPGVGAPWTPNAAVNALLTKPADGAAGSIMVSISDIRSGWIRFKTASTSGTWTAKVYVHAKGNG